MSMHRSPGTEFVQISFLLDPLLATPPKDQPHEQILISSSQGPSLINFVSFGCADLQKKIKMWKLSATDAMWC